LPAGPGSWGDCTGPDSGRGGGWGDLNEARRGDNCERWEGATLEGVVGWEAEAREAEAREEDVTRLEGGGREDVTRLGVEAREGGPGAEGFSSTAPRTKSAFQFRAHSERRGAERSSAMSAPNHSSGKCFLTNPFLCILATTARGSCFSGSTWERATIPADWRIACHSRSEIITPSSRRIARCMGGRDKLLAEQPTSGSALQSSWVQTTDSG
jgi:hypothetical protein